MIQTVLCDNTHSHIPHLTRMGVACPGKSEDERESEPLRYWPVVYFGEMGSLSGITTAREMRRQY